VSALEALAASEYDVLKMDENGSRLFAERVSGNFFDVLGAKPIAGREFLPAETRAGSAETVVVISHSLPRLFRHRQAGCLIGGLEWYCDRSDAVDHRCDGWAFGIELPLY
jgi:hypothetical protein